MKKTQYLLFMVAMLYTLSPLWAQAAFNDVTTDGGASIVLTNDSSSYVIDASNRVESFTVNASTIDFVVLPGSIISITSNDRKAFTYSATTCETVEKTCNSDLSRLFIQCNNQSTSHTVTVTPSGTCTASSGGGSNGGGGGSSAPVTPTPVTPAVKTEVKPESKVNEVPNVQPVLSYEDKKNSYQFKKQLSLGTKGADVVELQKLLRKLGYFTESKDTGILDKKTSDGVKKFQKAKGIAQVGNVGPATLKALNALSPITKPTPIIVSPEPVSKTPIVSTPGQFKKQLSLGTKGADVLALQKLLRQMGYFTYPSDTGTYGSATRDAVKKFQKANGIAQVGNVGPATLKALNK